jgi:hypothetical protein
MKNRQYNGQKDIKTNKYPRNITQKRARHVSGITFISYAQNRKVGKPLNKNKRVFRNN